MSWYLVYWVLAACICEIAFWTATKNGTIDTELDPRRKFIGFLFAVAVIPFFSGFIAPFVLLYFIWLGTVAKGARS